MAKAFTGKISVSIGANTSEVEKALKDLSKSISKVSKELISFGKNVSVSLTAPLTAWGAAATAAGLKVRDALNDVAVGTGATGEALRGLQADFKAIAGQVPDDMSLTAKAIADVNTMLGATGPELRDLSKGFLDLSRITKTDLGSNIESVTKLMNNWGLKASSGAKVLDELLFASQQTGVSVSELAKMLAESGNTFRTYNFSLEDSIAMLALLSKGGVEVEKFVTGLDRSLGNIAGAGIKDMREAFDALLMAIKNAPNDMRALQLAADLVGKISDVPLMSAVRSGGLEYQEFAKQIEEVRDTLQTFVAETEGFSAKWGRLTNQLTLALEPLGTHILKIAEEYMPALSDATGMLNIDFSDTTIKIGMIVAALGPATLALGAMTAAVSSLIAALKTLIVFVSGPVGLFVELSALGIALLEYTGQIENSRTRTEETAKAFAELSAQVRNMTMEQLRNQLVVSEHAMRDLERQAYKTQAAIAALESQRAQIVAENLIHTAFGGEIPFTQNVDENLAKEREELERVNNLLKNNQQIIDTAQKRLKELDSTQKKATVAPIGSGGGKVPDLSKSKKTSRTKTGKTEAEKYVENVQDRIKYLKEDGQKFLPTIEAMQAKLKPLSKDWKKLEDLRLDIDKTAFDKSIQDIQDQMKYLDQEGVIFVPQLQDMLNGFDLFSDKGKKIADVMKPILEEFYTKKWSTHSWEFSEGLLKATEYAELLKAELSTLTEGTDKWRTRFSELQNVNVSEVSKVLKKLSDQFQSGKIDEAGYETALSAIIQEFSDFPRVVQTATEALETFRKQNELVTLSTGRQLTNALREATRDFKELGGRAILGTVEGFLQASIYGEDFGESLKKLGQDIVYTTLKMVILSQLTQMLGTAFGGLFGFSGASVVMPQVNAKGNAFFDGHKLNAYAKGGLVNKPTVFPMANGMGLMGEAGAEAIMPLGRDSQGRLGVYGTSSGNTAPTVIVNVENQSGAQLTVQENGVSFDERFNRAVVSVILRDQATNGPISRNYRSVMR